MDLRLIRSVDVGPQETSERRRTVPLDRAGWRPHLFPPQGCGDSAAGSRVVGPPAGV